jgi:hypothetical protein
MSQNVRSAWLLGAMHHHAGAAGARPQPALFGTVAMLDIADSLATVEIIDLVPCAR